MRWIGGHGWRVAAAALAVAAAVTVAGCGGSHHAAAQASTPAVDAVARASRSVVALKADLAGERHIHSTAVIVDAGRGLVLTSDHNVEGATAITVTLPGGAAIAADELARAQCDDLALLRLAGRPPGLAGLPPAPAAPLRVGDEVIALGFPADVKDAADPDSAKLAATRGPVAMLGANVPLTDLLPALPALIGHQAPVSPGFSGGPLLSADGRLVGLTVAIGTHDGPAPAINLSFATSAARIAELMGQLRVTADGGYSGWKSEHACHGGMRQLAIAVSEPNHETTAGGAGGMSMEHEH